MGDIKYGKTPETTDFTVYKGWLYTRQFTADGTFCQQLETTLKQAVEAVARAGASPDGIVKCDVVLRDIAKEAQVIEAYRSIVSENMPAFRIAHESGMGSGVEVGVELTGVTLDSGLRAERFAPDDKGIPASVRAGDLVYTSNFLPDTKGSFEFEAGQVMEKTVKALEAAGASAANAVKNFAMLADIDRFSDFNTVYAKTFTPSGDPPARSLIGADSLNGFQASLESIAYTGERRKSISIGALSGKMPFCSAMIAGDFLFVSGQIGILNMDGTYNIELGPQTEHMYRVIDAVVKAAGCDMGSCLKYDGFAIKPEYQDVMRTKFAAAFPENDCARAEFVVSFLANAAILVEMDMVVAVEEDI